MQSSAILAPAVFVPFPQIRRTASFSILVRKERES